ncbi:hypothetical protein HGO38_23885 [Rhizobium sp. CG5]|uniref:glycoside hydrolase family 19 protein n=1 Tax=Rhizobium sp. CG5 TaxID=2726076 RepID=UPI002033B270|nr:glycoside hydrolase family 19 protein [Rhizobium sp. CG5]MCM2476490.1 hypothetical protein [Rhizobium sp. CG5]
MTLDEQRFYARCRTELYGGRLKQAQVSGLSAILDSFQKRQPDGDLRLLAYILATAHHETARTLLPVRETLAATDALAIRRLDTAFAAGRLPQVKQPYWRCDAEGKSWLGRGFVQLTHRRNYQRLGELLGVDLVSDPDRAMQLDVAADVLVAGMLAGAFTGRRLGEFFDADHADWTSARRVVNGTDRAALIGGYGRVFFAALQPAA